MASTQISRQDSDKPLSRSEKRRNMYRTRIIEAALPLFEANGVKNTTVAQIIEEADIAHKTFFNHFPTKNHLIQHIASVYANQADKIFLAQQESNQSAYKQLETSFVLMAEAMENLNRVSKELVTEVLIGVPENGDVRSEYSGRLTESVRKILQGARSNKQLVSGINLNIAVELLAGIFISASIRWATYDVYPFSKNMKGELRMIKASIFND